MFAQSALRDALAAVSDGPVEVATIAPIEAGTNRAYRLRLADETDRVLKVGTRFPDAFPAEPETMALVRRVTTLPVPRVYGTGTEPLGYPFTVYEYVPGTDHRWVGELPTRAADRLCREAGAHLRELHRIRFERFGALGMADEAEDGLSVVDPAPPRTVLRRSLDRQLAELRETPFADRVSALDALGADLIDRIDTERVEPTLVHGDYRLENLCIDPAADRITTAVLDWERPTSFDPLWDAVMASALLADGYRLDPEARRSLRGAFWDAYGDGADGTPRRRCYELLARIRLARHLDTEMRGEPDAAVTERSAEHEAAFEAMLESH
ncbi:phosphotransferase family protein [Halovivax limisalsi]|uniref:phosphotransferase family protein n=1 Tax=Halovivax limisalsi TaxID=1453760 RepID=UPI001FFC6412|nr:phosphotransferase [Halovivax limisalsi]